MAEDWTCLKYRVFHDQDVIFSLMLTIWDTANLNQTNCAIFQVGGTRTLLVKSSRFQGVLFVNF